MIAILLTGWVSAYFNPALALTAWINGVGIHSAAEYFAISGSTFVGEYDTYNVHIIECIN